MATIDARTITRLRAAAAAPPAAWLRIALPAATFVLTAIARTWHINRRFALHGDQIRDRGSRSVRSRACRWCPRYTSDIVGIQLHPLRSGFAASRKASSLWLRIVLVLDHQRLDARDLCVGRA
jgi:hypothetical protein